MEISPDILSINGIFVSAKAKYGDISKIIYKDLSGEAAVKYVEETLRNFLKNKNYLKEDDTPKEEKQKYFKELSLLLLLNCEFKQEQLKIEEHEHLTYNVPKLSKYLVTKVIVRLKLLEYFCIILETLPLQNSCEIFSEFLPTLDKEESYQIIQDSFCILQTIANIYLKNKELKFSDEMDVLLRHVPDFFFYITRLSEKDVANLQRKELYKRAGFVLDRLFNLLIFCYNKALLEGIFSDKLIDSTFSIVKAISLDMFLFWTELETPSGSLQSEIGEKAYHIIKKYENHTPAKDLVSSIKPFAKKPKSIQEQIHLADLNKMVSMINRADENQKKWYQALIYSSFFSNPNAMKCVNEWSMLCDEEDVNRLLNQSVQLENEEPKKLALKCASELDMDQLILVVNRHFHHNGFIIFEDIQQEMVLWFNKLKNSELVTEKNHHELLLFILRNPYFAIELILTQCIQSEFYISSLNCCFAKFKDILTINDICLTTLNKLMRDTTALSMENHDAYTKLIKILFGANLFTFNSFSAKVACPLLEEYLKQTSYDQMRPLLLIVNNLDFNIMVEDNNKNFFKLLFEIIRMRTNASNYNPAVQNAIQEAIHLITNKTVPNTEFDSTFFSNYSEENDVLKFYVHYLCSSTKSSSLLQNTVGNIEDLSHALLIGHLMKVLPFFVQDEWNIMCSEIMDKLGTIKLIETLRDMIILLSEFACSQENKDGFSRILDWLKHTVRQFGHILKIKVLCLNNADNETVITQSMVTMMSHFPQTLKEAEGLNIVQSLMTTKSLKQLNNDKKFIDSICNIRDPMLCQVIAMKILGEEE